MNSDAASGWEGSSQWMTVGSRKVQPPAVRNDLAAFRRVISNRPYWVARQGVPEDRFERRRRYLQRASPEA